MATSDLGPLLQTNSVSIAGGDARAVHVADRQHQQFYRLTLPHPHIQGEYASNVMVAGNVGDGAEIMTSSIPTSVEKSIVTGNDGAGIYNSGGTNIIVKNNKVLGNDLDDLYETIPGCSGDTWSGNVFTFANMSCIH